MAVVTLVETIETAEVKGRQEGVKRPKLNKEDLREEIDVILAACELFPRMEPDQVILSCSGYMARLTALHIQIQRVEHIRTDLKSVRTQEVDYAMEMVRDQYKAHSRLITVRQLDQDLVR